jgi:pilus assembly protein FimV
MLESLRLSFPTSMRAVIAASVLASLLGGGASTAMALSLGTVSSASRLGQPLDFAVAVKLDPDESLPPHCVSAEVTAGDNRIAPNHVRARLVRSGRGEAVARISTTVRLNEPVVTVTLSLGCPARLSHKFVSLLDPPLVAPRAATAAPAIPENRSAAPAAAQPPAVAVPPAQEPTAATGEPDEQRARERELLQGLDARIERLRQENQATQQTVQALQQRLRDAEHATRRTDPAIYGLMSLVLMLLVVIAVLLWRLQRLQRQRAWAEETQALVDQGGPPSQAPRVANAVVTPPLDEVTMTSMRVVSEPRTAPDEPPGVREAASTTIPAAARVRRELSAEELLDLEQQADFFIVLGQEDAAIDLLMSHVRSSGGTSPMPYLKLLEIYRRNGDGEAYERIRERFDRRFNAHAPPWASDPRDARALAEYPAIVKRLEVAWGEPPQAIELLEALLFRRDSSDETFELAAYEELLFLYAIARDVVEHTVDPSGVDLLLPLGADAVISSITRAEVTQPPQSWLRPAAGDVDLEIDIDPKAPDKR